MRFYTIPALIQRLIPALVCQIPVKPGEKKLYLTFDDGPGICTLWILEILEAHHARATFFVVGENVVKYPLLTEKIISAGHALGNHTQKHNNGWKISFKDYIESANNCDQLIHSQLFRPPYGKITFKQAKVLIKAGFRIIMWSFLTYDFEPDIKLDFVFEKMKKECQSGSIIVFHDNLKASPVLKQLLPKVLEHFGGLGYTFSVIK